MISKRNVLFFYNFLKKQGNNRKRDINFRLNMYRSAALYMYNYNVCYSDSMLEKSVIDLVSQIVSVDKAETSETVLFYEYAPKDGRGLAHIYLEALVDSMKPFVWVTYKSYETEKELQLVELVNNSAKGMMVVVNDEKSEIELIKQINDVIIEFQPKQALLIPSPQDVEMIGLLALHKEISKILVNGTDHTYWFGHTIFDRVLEFRNFGYTVSKNLRGIDEARLECLPYYPHPSGKKFDGYPFMMNKPEKLVVSGGSFYKIYGSTVFFDVVKYLVTKYKNVKFYFMGSGDSRLFNQFIKRNSLEDKVFVSSERADFDEVIKRAFLYINTYPLAGALMAQYAIANGTIPVGICPKIDVGNDISELLLDNDVKLMYENEIELFEEIDKLMTDDSYYFDKKNSLKDSMLNRESFGRELKKILNDEKNNFILEEDIIDIENFTKQYLVRGSIIKSIKYVLKALIGAKRNARK